MKRSEAAKLVAALAAYWPGTDIRDDTASLWEQELVPFELADGMEAASLLGRSGRFMPSLAEFTDAIRECRNDRLRAERPVLPPARSSRYPFAVFLAEHPEMQARVKALDSKRSLMQQTFAQLLKDEIG